MSALTQSSAKDAELGMAAGSSASQLSQMPSEVEQALLPKVRLAASYHHPFSPARRRYMVVLVAVLTALLCADQNLLAPNLSAAAAFFGLDDAGKDTILGGYLMAAFFLIGAPTALLCGYLADRFNRVWMLFAIVIIGETPCLCTYWVTQIWQFFLVRMLTGVAVGGSFPLVFSLLGDLFPITQRSAMAALVQIAVGAGIAGGQVMAGIVGPATNWRVPFVVMAAPSLLLAILLVTTTSEPPRGGFEAALAGQLAAGGSYSETITWAKVKRLLSVPSNWIIIVQGLPGCLPWGVMQTYINDYLHTSKGFSVEMSTVIVLLFGVGCAAGVLAGGAAGQLLYNWRKESMAVLTGLSVLAGTAPVYFLVNADLQSMSFGVSLVMSGLAGFLVSIAGPNLRALMINVNTPETRGVALALQSVTDDLGRGLGPVLVAGFISGLGRVGAFNVAVAGWVPCGLLLLSLVFTMRRDEAVMQQQLADRAGVALDQMQTAAGSSGGRSTDAAGLGAGTSGGAGGGIGDAARAEAAAAAAAAVLAPAGLDEQDIGGRGRGSSSHSNSPRFRVAAAAAAAGLGSSRLGRTTLEHANHQRGRPLSMVELSSGSSSDGGSRPGPPEAGGSNSNSHGAHSSSVCASAGGSSAQLLDASSQAACSSDGGLYASRLPGLASAGKGMSAGGARHRGGGVRSRSSSTGSQPGAGGGEGAAPGDVCETAGQ